MNQIALLKRIQDWMTLPHREYAAKYPDGLVGDDNGIGGWGKERDYLSRLIEQALEQDLVEQGYIGTAPGIAKPEVRGYNQR